MAGKFHTVVVSVTSAVCALKKVFLYLNKEQGT